jgi:hypothetical protein
MSRGDVTFVTPTFARDYERFCLQRESLERCGVEIPHVAIVNHEDLAQFARMPFKKNLTLVSTADVLPASFEKRRKLWGISRRKNPKYWLSGKGIHGWGIQQLLKLAAPKVAQTEAIVCLDSDVFFLDQVKAGDFFGADGRVHLYETQDDLDAQMAEWYARALRFLGVATQGQELRRYTHAPVPWRRDVLLDLQRFLEKRYAKSWMDAVLEGDRITEYALYGAFARHVDELKRVEPVRPALTLYYWWPAEIEKMAANFSQRAREGRFKMALIQSNAGRGVADYRGLIEKAWAGGVTAA